MYGEMALQMAVEGKGKPDEGAEGTFVPLWMLVECIYAVCNRDSG